MDYHQWLKESTTAPVMFQLELHNIITSLAIFHMELTKNCGKKQAFVQSSLLQNEEYIVKPHLGCSHSPPGTYWCLIHSLYGLCRAPKLWYDKLYSHVKENQVKENISYNFVHILHVNWKTNMADVFTKEIEGY
jgi:hypothetical protein